MAENVNKTTLVANIAASTGHSQSAVASIIDAMFEEISGAVAKGSKVTIPGYFTAERTETSARTGRNPRTGEEIKIPAGHRVKLTAGSKLKSAVK